VSELSPYQRELARDLVDYELFARGLEAFERISGLDAKEVLNLLAESATQEQRERVISRCTRAEEFYRLPDELQARLRGAA
jgi:hypothetical protein